MTYYLEVRNRLQLSSTDNTLMSGQIDAIDETLKEIEKINDKETMYDIFSLVKISLFFENAIICSKIGTNRNQNKILSLFRVLYYLIYLISILRPWSICTGNCQVNFCNARCLIIMTNDSRDTVTILNMTDCLLIIVTANDYNTPECTSIEWIVFSPLQNDIGEELNREIQKVGEDILTVALLCIFSIYNVHVF